MTFIFSLKTDKLQRIKFLIVIETLAKLFFYWCLITCDIYVSKMEGNIFQKSKHKLKMKGVLFPSLINRILQLILSVLSYNCLLTSYILKGMCFFCFSIAYCGNWRHYSKRSRRLQGTKWYPLKNDRTTLLESCLNVINLNVDFKPWLHINAPLLPWPFQPWQKTTSTLDDGLRTGK